MKGYLLFCFFALKISKIVQTIVLKKQQEEIEKEFGEPLEWDELPKHKSSRISIHKSNTDPTDEADWKNQHEWFKPRLELFYKVFYPKIKELNAADCKPSNDKAD